MLESIYWKEYQKTNASTIINFIQALKSEVNPTDYHNQTVIMPLKQLSEFHNNTKSY
jgi:hypothetical protein